MRAAGKEGEVIVQYVVDQNGAVEMPSLKVLKATDPAFVAAVREALPSFRYIPAEASGHAVKQLVQEPFKFTLNR
jgi:protein TonB